MPLAPSLVPVQGFACKTPEQSITGCFLPARPWRSSRPLSEACIFKTLILKVCFCFLLSRAELSLHARLSLVFQFFNALVPWLNKEVCDIFWVIEIYLSLRKWEVISLKRGHFRSYLTTFRVWLSQFFTFYKGNIRK